MSHRLSAVSGVLVLLWAGSAWALGLGEIEAKSRLNQPLLAQIPISAATPAELDSLVVTLASNEDFERLGLERREFLSSLSFELQGNVIRVRSKESAREPFVAFLLDLRWKGGRLLREYTILLDPPTLAKPQAAKPAAEVAASAPAKKPVLTSTLNDAPDAPTSLPAATTPVAKAPAAAAIAGPMDASYGPVLPQETLWSIAYKLRPDPESITMDQMQVALLQANPQAFKDGDIRSLLKGSVLTVPTESEIRAVDPVSAKAKVSAARGAAVSPMVTAPVKQAAPAPAPVIKPAPPVVAKAEAPAPEPAAKPEPKPEPAKVIEPAKKPESAAPAAVKSESPAPIVAEAPKAAEPAAQPEAATKPAEAEVAQAPAQAEPAASTPAAATPNPAASAPVIKKPKYDVEWTGFLDRGQELLGPYALPALAGIVVLVAGLFGFGKLKDRYAKWSYDRASRKVAAASDDLDRTAVEKTQLEAPTVGDEAPTLINRGADSSLAATQAMPAAMDLGATQAMESSVEATLQQTMQQEPASSASGARAVDFDVTGQYATETVQINLDAGDPVSEAEFHRAYGLYDEAALLLNQALKKDPGRTEARVKLAEIYFESSKASDFVAVAKQLKEQLPSDEWQKIALMGNQIAPNESLFSDAGAGGAVDLSFDEPAAPTPPPAKLAATAAAQPKKAPEPVAAAPEADSGMLDFKLDDVMTESPAPAAPAASSARVDKGDSLEFDLGDLSLDEPAAEPTASAEASAGEMKLEGLDLGDFDIGDGAADGDSLSLDSGDAPSVEGDDASTKLDLARAYVDMGDNDMAKGLLNEVLQQGNDQQKKEAEELLQRVQA